MLLTDAEPGAGAKLDFLKGVLGQPNEAVECIETHMSWMFIGRDLVLKMKKPVRHRFLDFSTV